MVLLSALAVCYQLSSLPLVRRGKLVILAVSPPYRGLTDRPMDATLTIT